MAAKRLIEKEKAIINKSDMLDQVNELMDTMTAERLALTERIVLLEKQLQEKTRIKQPPHSTAEPTTKVMPTTNMVTLKRQLEEERQSIKTLQESVGSLSQYIASGKQALATKLHTSQQQTQECELALKTQCKENAKLKSELGRFQTHIQTMKNRNKELSSSLEETKLRYRKTRTALLALRGQISRDKKQQEPPKTKPLVASSRSPLAARPLPSAAAVSDSKNNGRVTQLHAEMKRKDQLIRSYDERLSDQDTRCSSAEQKLSEMKNLLEEQKKRCVALEKDLNDKTTECSSVHCRLTNTEMKLHQLEGKYTDANKSLERKLIQFETQFHQSRNELKDLKSHLSRTEEALEQSRRQLQREQTQTKKLIDSSQEVVDGLKAQLNQSRKKHQSDVARLKRALMVERQQAQKEVERMKDVSAQRCTELAHEVWLLRSQMGDPYTTS